MRKFIISHTYIFASAFVLLSLLVSSCAKSQTPANTQLEPPAISANAININTATAEEIAQIPKIGEHFARKIVEFRETYGKFRKPEHLMLVEGIGDRKYRSIRAFVKTE